MLHKSILGEHAAHFPQDEQGHIPEPGDHWSHMKFELGPNSPFEEGLSHEEREKRTQYLDQVWWPKILEHVSEGRKKLAALPEGNPIRYWREVVDASPTLPHGIQVD